MKRGSTKIAHLDVDIRIRVAELRRKYKSVNEICFRLGLDKPSERNAVTKICAEPGLRAYAHGMDVSGPVKAGRNPAAVIRP
jgi:hypothetical protein